MQTKPANTWANVESLSPVSKDAEQEEPQSSGMNKIRIRGGKQLNGEIAVSGAKNAALKLMCAALLSEESLFIDNMPTALRDIGSQIDFRFHLP